MKIKVVYKNGRSHTFPDRLTAEQKVSEYLEDHKGVEIDRIVEVENEVEQRGLCFKMAVIIG